MSASQNVRRVLEDRYPSVNEELLDHYDDIRSGDPAHDIEMFDRYLEVGADIFNEQWSITFSDYDDMTWKNKVVGADYSNFCVDDDTPLEDVATLFEYAIDEQVYESWREFVTAAWEDDKDYVTAVGLGVGGVTGAATAPFFAPETLEEWSVFLEVVLGGGGAGGIGWGWKNLHRKYGPEAGVIGGMKHIIETGGDLPESAWGCRVREDALDNLVLLDPDYRTLSGGELEERIQEEGEQFFRDKSIDTMEEWKELTRIPEDEARHSCKYLVAVFDPTPDKQHLWNVVDMYFPEQEFDTLDDMEAEDLAYTTTEENNGAAV